MSTRRDHSQAMGKRAGEVIFSQWMELERLRKAVLKKKTPEAIHDLRVASRRIRITLALFAPFIRDRFLKQLTRKLRRFTRELGRLRNIDEAIAYFAPYKDDLSELGAKLTSCRKRELKAVLQYLKQFPTSLVDQLCRLIVEDLSDNSQQNHLDATLPAYLSKLAVARFKPLHKLMLPAADPDDADTRHELRIAIKKWRYLLESMNQIFGHNYKEALDLLKEYQSILGRLNDMAEFAVLCGEMNLSDDIKTKVALLLKNDAAGYLERFLIMVESRRPHYTFYI